MNYNLTRCVAVRVDDELYRRIESIAQTRRVTVSWIARQYLKRGVEQDERNPHPPRRFRGGGRGR